MEARTLILHRQCVPQGPDGTLHRQCVPQGPDGTLHRQCVPQGPDGNFAAAWY